MHTVWILVAFLVACIGGWPLTAGVLRLAKSHPVRAAEARERGEDDSELAQTSMSGMSGSDTGAAEHPVVDRAVARLAASERAANGQHVPAESPANDFAVQPRLQSKPVGVLRGGLFIGILERGAVVLAIITGQPVAIAYVVAIKGLGRYPELKSAPEASERFIIGTLTSMLWAVGVTVLAKVLLL